MRLDKTVLANVALSGGNRQQRSRASRIIRKNFMALSSFSVRVQLCCLLAAVAPFAAHSQGNYAASGGEYNVSGVLPGEQVYPKVSIRPSGGYLVWQDNYTDGTGLGISALKLDSSLSATFSPFRVNQNGNFDQERPSVSMLNDGGAVFVWEGGKQSFQHIYARFLAADGTWATGDLMVNTTTNRFQLDSSVVTLANGNVVVTWSTFNQVNTNSMRDVYAQILTPTGAKVGGEMLVNQATAFNQRSATIAPLSDGRFVIVWVSEQQRFENSVDLYGRIFHPTGAAATGEFLVNTSTNICSDPSVARSSDGGFAVAWMQRAVDFASRSNRWDIYLRPFTAGTTTATGGTTRQVNTWNFGDQLAPEIASMGTDYLVVWTSMGQDGNREGVYGQFARGDGSLLYSEFRVNTSTFSQQMHPAVASDGVGQFLSVWTSYMGGARSFDLFGQRYFNTAAPLPPPGAPIVTVLSSNSLSVTWPPVQGYSIANYEVYADGSATATAVVTNTYWTATGLAPASTHSYRLAYVLTDGRRSPLSSATSKTTYSGGATWGGIPQEWMVGYFGDDLFAWPSPHADSDGDGVSNRDEFFQGTDPTNANSVLRQRIMQTAQGPYLSWNTQPGLVYQVMTMTNMNSWQNVGGPRFAPGYLDSIYVGGGSGKSGFYRIMRLR